jgi:hypothetical protein
MFWQKVSQKTKHNIVMLMLFICLKLLSVIICYNFSFFIWLVSMFVNCSHIFLCFVVTQWFCPVCIKHHTCTLLGISLFDSKHLCTIILCIVLLLTCFISYLLFLFVDLWNINKISISISMRRTRDFLPINR